MQNPVFATQFPAAQDPPLPPTRVADQNLFNRFDLQIRALQQFLLSLNGVISGHLREDLCDGGRRRVAGAPRRGYTRRAHVPAWRVDRRRRVVHHHLDLHPPSAPRRKPRLHRRREVAFTEPGTATLITFGIYKNGVLLPDTVRPTDYAAGEKATVRMSALNTVANTGDFFQVGAFTTGASGTTTLAISNAESRPPEHRGGRVLGRGRLRRLELGGAARDGLPPVALRGADGGTRTSRSTRRSASPP